MIWEFSGWISRIHAKTRDEKRGAEAPLWYDFVKSLEGVEQANRNRVGGISREDA